MSSNPSARNSYVEVAISAEGRWDLKYFPSGEHCSSHASLLDAVIAREWINNKIAPPFERWLIDGVEEVSPPVVADHEISPSTSPPKHLNLRRWEYEEICHTLDADLITPTVTYSDEFETKFHYAVQQRSSDPLVSDDIRDTDVDNGVKPAIDAPFYARHLWFMITLLALGATFIYGVCIEPNWLKVTTHDVGAPTQVEPIKVAQISDLHLTSLGRLERQVLEQLKSINADVIVFSGDVIDDKNSLVVLETFLSQLPDVKKVATLGNWEHWSEVDISRLKDIYQKSGVETLINACTSVTDKIRSVQILGLDDYGAGQIDIRAAFAKCKSGSPIVLVQHTPMFFDEDTGGLEKNIVLSIAGHTHGGQITFGGLPIFTPPGSGKYVRGWYETKWGKLYVSAGLGTSIVPIRLFVRPEISVFNLY